LREEEKIPASATEARKNVVAAIKTVAEQLGNTPAVCRKCYVHPAVLDKYLDGTIRETLARQVEQQAAADPHALKPDEAAVMRLLREEVSAA
jgi:DNA topoisomerase-1